MIWVVWFHAPHPEFIGFSFCLPFFFFASGMFFKVKPLKEYVKTATIRLIIPFIFYYLLYYCFMIVENYWETGNFHSFRYDYILSVFRRYAGDNIYPVNSPLWFISALIWLQLITMFISRLIRSKLAMAIVFIVLGVLGTRYIQPHLTWFMFGRSFRFLIYFGLGYIYGKSIVEIMDYKTTAVRMLPLGLSVIVYGVCLYVFRNRPPVGLDVTYIEGFCLIILMMYLFKWIHRYPIAKPFRFYGLNTIPILGLHLIIITTLGDAWLFYVGDLNPYMGAGITLGTLLALWPITNLINRRFPYLSGRAK